MPPHTPRERPSQAAESTTDAPAWHAIAPDEVAAELGTSLETGLSQAEAERRLKSHGPNKLPRHKPTPWWRIAIWQFKSPLIYVLAVAAVISFAIGEFTDGGFIVAVLALNAIIGTIQEWRAERQMKALEQLLTIRTAVERDGDTREIEAENIVPGDRVHLAAGNRVPADIRLLTADGLRVDESLLTGESTAIDKNPEWQGTPDAPLAEQANMAFAGSTVAGGRAVGVCVATGQQTHVGQLAHAVTGHPSGKPPLVSRMERFTRVVAVAVVIAAAIVAILGGVIGRYGWTEMFLFAVALCVSAIPEGLPVGMTVALAVVTSRMAKRGVIVRKLTAVEGLGSCTLIAADKTGTLTANALTVRRIQLADGDAYAASGQGFQPDGAIRADDPADAESTTEPGIHADDNAALHRLLRTAILCNEATLKAPEGGGEDWTTTGDAVDLALLVVAEKAHADRTGIRETFPRVGEIPFESQRQFAATFHRTPEDRGMVCVKGAPEKILAMCRGDESVQHRHQEAAEHLAKQGFRLLAFADADRESAAEAPSEPRDLEFLGLVAMIDPLRPNVPEAIQACHDAGVQVAMITGDHAATARAIAANLDLADANAPVITGRELADIADEDLAEKLRATRVFARIDPTQKLKLVSAAKGAGHFVAVTGDGVNDAPALRAAHIGIAMGEGGTDVAREASDLVIADDNFATIVAGIEEGRIAYANIRKVIFLLISTGAAEIVLLMTAIVGGMPLPLVPVQILWLNLVTNGIQDVALAFEPKEGGELNRPPRPPSEPIFDRLMIERVAVAAVWMGGVSLAAFLWLMENGTPLAEARNLTLLLLVLFENVHLFNSRSERFSALRISPLRSPILLAGVVGAFGLHVLAMHTPIGEALIGAIPASPLEWAIVAALALTILPVMEIHKFIWHKRHGTHFWQKPGETHTAVAESDAATKAEETSDDHRAAA